MDKYWLIDNQVMYIDTLGFEYIGISQIHILQFQQDSVDSAKGICIIGVWIQADLSVNTHYFG
jgi:hypothetical protein